MLVAAGCSVVLLGTTPYWIQLPAVGAVGAVGFGLWRAGWIGSRHRIVGLHRLPAEISADTRVVRNAVWLRWTGSAGRKRSMLVVHGDMPAEQLRALCVRLRIDALERALPEARTR
ncbi:MAG: hypothetical protein ACREXP_01380 [Steroidobacteraceae bacterium]